MVVCEGVAVPIGFLGGWRYFCAQAKSGKVWGYSEVKQKVKCQSEWALEDWEWHFSIWWSRTRVLVGVGLMSNRLQIIVSDLYLYIVYLYTHTLNTHTDTLLLHITYLHIQNCPLLYTCTYNCKFVYCYSLFTCSFYYLFVFLFCHFHSVALR